MPVIKPRGLLKGERLAQLSDEAKLYWPFLYAGSNGYGRFEVNYRKIIQRCFDHFRAKPPQSLIRSVLAEYKEQQLLFLYEAHGELWAAWDSAARQNFYNHDDEHSPIPPEPQFSNWKRAYRERKTTTDKTETDELADQFRAGIENNVQSIETSQVSLNNPRVSVSTSESQEVSVPPPSISISKTSVSNTSTTSETTTRAPAIAREAPNGITHSELGIEGWDELVELGSSVAMVMDPDPGSDLCQKFWRRQSFESRLERIKALREKIACGQFSDPQYVPSLENFVRTKYKESHRPKAKAVDRGQALIARIRAEEAEKTAKKSATSVPIRGDPESDQGGGYEMRAAVRTG